VNEANQASDKDSMISRFSGESGKALLMEVLSETALLCNFSDLQTFVEQSDLIEVVSGQTLITQGGSDNDLFIIVSGCFDIVVNGRVTATRKVGTHFGEMALVDSTARRSATVVASESGLILKCSYAKFVATANANPQLWRRIAIEITRRLTERNRFIKTPRSQPVLFLGCSREALSTAREIQSTFDHDSIIVEIWTDGIFNTSKTPIEDLNELVQRIDFGAVLLTPDDLIQSRDNATFGPRDNVVFELGLIMGAIGRERTFMLSPRGANMKLPSDLLGVKPIDYPTGDMTSITSRMGPACNELRKIINSIGPI